MVLFWRTAEGISGSCFMQRFDGERYLVNRGLSQDEHPLSTVNRGLAGGVRRVRCLRQG